MLSVDSTGVQRFSSYPPAALCVLCLLAMCVVLLCATPRMVHAQSPLYTLNSPNPEVAGGFGRDLAIIDDMNGDGTPDVLIGDPGEDDGATINVGRAYLMSGANGQLLRTFSSPNPERTGFFGTAVADVGDFNGDTVPDLLISARGETVSGDDRAGRVYLFSGADGSVLDTFTSPNSEANGAFGADVVALGDVTGDGTPDFGVGTREANASGRVYIMNGDTGIDEHTIASPNSEGFGDFGVPLDALGDVTGDGVTDLVAGANDEDGDGVSDSGRAYILDGANGTIDETIISPNVDDNGCFGLSVGRLGDVTGDGIAEVLVGAPCEDPSFSSNAGNAYVFDGTDASLVYELTSPTNNSSDFFGNAVADVGDLDGDGTTDFAINAGFFAVTGIEGRIYVFSGADKSQLFDLAPRIGGDFGDVIAGGEDLDGDTEPEFLASAPTKDQLGRVYVVGSRSLGLRDLGISITDVEDAAVAWGDYDTDGDFDLLVTGEDNGGGASTTLYENQGGSTFASVSTPFPDVRSGSVDWGDYDNDGDLDLVITGFDGSGRVASIYRNDGGGTFIDIGAVLTGVSVSSSTWGDYDNDGDLDLVVTGYDGSSPITTIYTNDAGTFTPLNDGLVGVKDGATEWGDYDQDGDLDLALAGEDDIGGDYHTIIYRNDGSTFTDIGASLADVTEGDVAWGDYDDDGDLDLLVVGYGDSFYGDDPVGVLYENEGNGSFDSMSFPNLGFGAAADWGDYDNDGDLDILASGLSSQSNAQTNVLTNDGTGSFLLQNRGATGLDDQGLRGTIRGDVAWADYDRDGDLDAVVVGTAPAGIFENQEDPGNAAPDRPSNLTRVEGGNTAGGTAQFAWTAASDQPNADGVAAPSSALTYNAFVKNRANSELLMAPEALLSGPDQGTRFVAAPGNVGSATEFTIHGLDQSGVFYEVGVQALDPNFDGSRFNKTLVFFSGALAAGTSETQTVDSDGTIDFGATGVDIDFAGTSGSGDVTVKKFDGTPLQPESIADPNVSQYSFVIESDGTLSFSSSTIVRLDVSTLGGISDPTSVTVYKRDLPGRGAFTDLTTGYDSSTDEITAAVGSFSEFALGSTSDPLPVELTRFDARRDDQTVHLAWETASETNNAAFEVQRRASMSADDESALWTSLHRLEGAGTTSEGQHYRFTDRTLPFTAEAVTYRLKQFDTDGTTSLSDPVTVDIGAPDQMALHAPFPNPTRGRTTLRYVLPEHNASEASAGQPVTIRLYNVLGQQVATLVDDRQTAGRKEVTLNAEQLSSGVYFVQMRVGQTLLTERITVVR